MVQFNTHIIPQRKGTFIVGGSIRDILAHRIPSDYDFVVLDHPKEFALDIGERTNGQVITLGKPGLTLYRVMSHHGIFDVTQAAGSSILEDLSKRDFTVNAMAVDLVTGDLIDPYHGKRDLETKKIRMVSDEAFKDDPIRLLRAFRLGALFGFDIEEGTRLAIRDNRARMKQPAGERIHAELIKIFETPHSFPYIKEMVESGIMFAIFPELEALTGCPRSSHHGMSPLEHTVQAYRNLESVLNNLDDFIPEIHRSRLRLRHNIGLLKYAILLHDIGKPTCITCKDSHIHFYGHETRGAKMAEDICLRLKFSNYEKKYTRFIIRHHLYPLFLFTDKSPETIAKKAQTKFYMTCGDYSPDIALHAYADFTAREKDGNQPANDAFKRMIAGLIEGFFTTYVPVKKEKRVLTGRDLIDEFRMTPSPFFRTILDQVEESRLSGHIHSRNEALAMVRHILEIGNNHSSS